MTKRSVLISGLGIAGPALAHWLLRAGFAPTLVERAPALRTGGYMIDFWGVGYDVAETMGLLPAILDRGYHVRQVRMVDARGRRAGGFAMQALDRATSSRYISLPRGDLGAILYRAIERRVPVMFGDSITALDDQTNEVVVQFEHSPPQPFDLVIGADGLHSTVRSLVFGPETEFAVPLGYTVAAFEVSRYRPRDDDAYVVYAEPGRQIMRFAMRDDRTGFLVVLSGDPGELPTADAQRAYIEQRCAGMAWEAQPILAAMRTCDEVYVDRVVQIRMPRWSRGRIALVGDAAFSPSLLAGQGSALAIVASYVLAGELATAPNIDHAFLRYEHALRSFIHDKQVAAARFASSFAPRSSLAIWLRNLVTRAFAIPHVAELALGSTMTDELDLPDYETFGPLPALHRRPVEHAPIAH
jgi:2-polyprenyl-6-methoxyphenol hydroxylase-like FAD-dependent oxidoreductase